jgi:hypothetical protein
MACAAASIILSVILDGMSLGVAFAHGPRSQCSLWKEEWARDAGRAMAICGFDFRFNAPSHYSMFTGISCIWPFGMVR